MGSRKPPITNGQHTEKIRKKPRSIESQQEMLASELEEDLSLNEAALFIRVTRRTIAYLLDHGLISAAEKPSRYRERTWAISVKNLLNFKRTYISLGEIVERSGYAQGALSMRLRNNDLDMMALPPDLSKIYWRNDIENFMPEVR
jgi:hypothetical protein